MEFQKKKLDPSAKLKRETNMLDIMIKDLDNVKELIPNFEDTRRPREKRQIGILAVGLGSWKEERGT